ncbi:MAG: hypothetical protein VKL59_09230 [Nostocaceae cyanobacterium]|nr:hypothetical protein [Nostocaceae cyanobacterium]
MNPNHLHPKDADNLSLFISFFLCILIVVGFLQTSEQFLHWFVIPVTLSGILMGIDAVNWFRSRLNIFDPVGIIGLLGFHFFFLVPLLSVSWDYWMESGITPPSDWRPWLGGMAILNFLGIWVYRIARNLASKPVNYRSKQQIWRIDRNRFPLIISFALIFSGLLQLVVYKSFGGIIGYITAFTDTDNRAGEGMGWLFMLSETFPILAMIRFAVYAKRKKTMQIWHVFVIVLLIFLVLQILFGGLRGSRSNTIWALFWAVGIIHFWLRPIKKQQIAIGLVFLMLFMYMYGFYKAGGLEGFTTALKGQKARAELAEKKGRGWEPLLLQDLGRSDIQAFLLYRLMRHDSDYEYAWGRTYFGTVTFLIPKAIWPGRPPAAGKEGIEAQYGRGTYAAGWETSKIYGLTGEAMLNFTPFAIPFSFIPLGIAVGLVRRSLLSWKSDDSRLLLLPMLVNLCFVILVGDSLNVLFFLIKNSSIPTLVIWLSSKKEVISH